MKSLNVDRAYEFEKELHKKYHRPLHVLIIDDDIDSALKVETVFSQLNCSTVIAFGIKEAKHMMCQRKADIIILDWMLDPHVNGGDILIECANVFARFGHLLGPDLKKTEIVTYSSLNENQINWPRNAYFKHLDHWRKPISQREILMGALSVINEVKRVEGSLI